ncbi:MAG: alpha-hydroxy-acid oxidizing protein [Steroidobacteraceae bacterium]
MGNTTRRRILQTILAPPALDAFDLERLARAKLPPAHWGYLETGVDGDATLHANEAGFANYGLRVRRLVDISRVDTSVSLFGATWPSPIFLDPVGSRRACHADGEIASAKARPCAQAPADSLDDVVSRSRGSQRRARRVGLVPALPH